MTDTATPALAAALAAEVRRDSEVARRIANAAAADLQAALDRADEPAIRAADTARRAAMRAQDLLADAAMALDDAADAHPDNVR